METRLRWAYCSIHSHDYLYSPNGTMGCSACRDEKPAAPPEDTLASLRETVATLQADLTLLAEKVVIERAESNALRATISTLQGENQELRQALKNLVSHFRSDFVDPGLEIYGLVGGRELCYGGQHLNRILDESDALLAKPVAPDQPTKEEIDAH